MGYEKVSEKSWRSAIERALSEADTPLHYSEISEYILSRGYYSTDGATPAATVNAVITNSIAKEGEKSPFVRVDKGTFSIRNKAIIDMEGEKKGTPGNIQKTYNDSSGSIIHAFGMYWQRDLIVWRHNPMIYGKQQAQSKAVDFGTQKGVYILYDQHTVVYVGRSIDRPLGTRLYEHTIDRLNSRWNRFSWFGLLDVTEEGELIERSNNSSLDTIIATLEGLLIEALEPPQNRKRGDDISAVEYIQSIDPEIREKEIKNTLREIEQRIRNNL